LNNVTGCTIQNNNVYDNNSVGIGLQLSDSNDILENTCNNNNLAGIGIIASSTNTISSNICTSNNKVDLGEGLSFGYGIVVSEERGENPPTTASYSVENTLDGNTCSENEGDGIYLGWNCNENVIQNNTANQNSNDGIYIWKAGTNDVLNNEITGNLEGIQLMGSPNNTIAGNTITNNTNIGIWLRSGWTEYEQHISGYELISSGNLILNNNISGNGSYGIKYDDNNQYTTDDDLLIDASPNYWGDPAGPTPPGVRYGNGVTTNVDYDPWWADEEMTTLNGLPDIVLSEVGDISTITNTPVVFDIDVAYPNDIAGYDPSVLTDARITSDTSFPTNAKVKRVVYDDGTNQTPFTLDYSLTGTEVYLSDILGVTASPLAGHNDLTVNWEITITGFDVEATYGIEIQSVSYIVKGTDENELGEAEEFTVTFADADFTYTSSLSSVLYDETYPLIDNNGGTRILNDSRWEFYTDEGMATPYDLPIGATITIGEIDGNGDYTWSRSSVLTTSTSFIYGSAVVTEQGDPSTYTNGQLVPLERPAATNNWKAEITGVPFGTYYVKVKNLAMLDVDGTNYNPVNDPGVIPQGPHGTFVEYNYLEATFPVTAADVDVYVDAPESLIKDEELQEYSVKVAAISTLRTFEVELQYLKADFDAAANFAIGTEFTTAGVTPNLEVVDNSNDTYWNYVVTGGFLGAPGDPANVSGTDVDLFTVEITSLVDVSNLTGSTIDLVDVLFYDNNDPYAEIPWDSLTDKDIVIDSGEPTMSHDNDGDYTSPYTLQTGVLPELDFTFDDDYNLDDVQYLVQAEGAAAPTLPGDFSGNYIVQDFDGTSTSVTDWFFTQSELDALADGTYTIYYLVLDDAGNFTIYGWDFIKDTSAPDAVTWVSCLTSIDANNSIDLEWENPTDAARNHIWYLDFASLGGSGYPEYAAATGSVPAAPDPTAASPQSGWTIIDTITAATTYTWTVMDRGYYYLVVFAEDASGNIGSAPDAPFYRESISYWPGDVYDEPDGIVNSDDINTLSTAWDAVDGGTGWNNLVDVGPTVDNGRRSLPTPDDVIDIEDLMIFAMNYDNTDYDYYPRVDEEDITPVHIDMICYQQGEMLSIDLVLSGNENLLKGLNIPVNYGNGYQLESLETGEIWPEGSMMLHTNSNGIVEISITALGSEAVVEGDGVIATLLFEEIGNSVPELCHMTARTPNNQEIEIINNPEVTESDEEVIIPVNDILLSNYPNPFNPSTTIAFGLKEEAEVSLVIYNIKGQLVNTLVEGVLPAGRVYISTRCRQPILLKLERQFC